ncbi:hypothetical protein BDW74DRAFT_180776 [Aspergillus multicolor]|uniref:uncharacterized protein n=1 Tax=Aspergillus multicolor TaxID=41759 RepID=UPI003CCD3BD7
MANMQQNILSRSRTYVSFSNGRPVDSWFLARQPTFTPFDAAFFITWKNEQGGTGEFEDDKALALAALFPDDPGADESQKPLVRLMGALGSKTNNGNFYLLEADINGMKARIFGNIALIEATTWSQAIENVDNPSIPLKSMKAAIAVCHYQNDDEVNESWETINGNVRSVFRAIDKWRDGGSQFLDAWDEWYCDWVKFHKNRTKAWVLDGISRMRTVWEEVPLQDPARMMVLSILTDLESDAEEFITLDLKIFPRCK